MNLLGMLSVPSGRDTSAWKRSCICWLALNHVACCYHWLWPHLVLLSSAVVAMVVVALPPTVSMQEEKMVATGSGAT